MKIIQIISLIFALSLSVFSQAISVSPEFPTANDEITITFKADEATNNSLVGYTGTLYAHTGLITNKSADESDWQYVIESWGNNQTQPALTRIDANTYELEIGQPKTFYSFNDPTEKIIQLAFVFRSSDASSQTENLYVDIYEPGLAITLQSPTQLPIYPLVGESIDFILKSSKTATLSLYIDDELVIQSESDSLEYTYITTGNGRKKILFTAEDSTETYRDSSHLFVRNAITIQELPVSIETGINYVDETTVILALYAPGKDFVYLIGDFNDWLFDPDTSDTWDFDENYYMDQTADGNIFWKTITGLTPGEEYAFQYLVEGNLRIADPYANKILDPNNDSYITTSTYPNLKAYPTIKTTEIVSIFQTNQNSYEWNTEAFEKPANEDLVIYELLLRDFLAEHDFKTLKDTLNYLKNLGVNAIELMPINEFEGNNSWGYNPSFYFAVDKYYGPADDLKAFIDECHTNGIAVLLDIVLNHSYGQSPFVRLYSSGNYGPPTADNPWYNVSSPNTSYSWGYDFNHESEKTKELVDRILEYWMTEYRFDGFRFDFTKGFTQTVGDGWGYDASRIAILKRISDHIWNVDPNAYVILEHLTDNREETELANYGMMLWGKMTDQYNEATMGYTENNKSDLSQISYLQRGWEVSNLVGYMESHDEERLMYKNMLYGNSSGNYDITNLNIALQRMKLAGAFFFSIPGPKMLWQFGELGYDYSINYPSHTESDRLTPKPIRWGYLELETRSNLNKVWSELIKLKTTHDVFKSDNFVMDVDGSLKTITLTNDTMSVFIVGNFSVNNNTMNFTFPHNGIWYDYFEHESINISGSHVISLLAGDFHLFTDKNIYSSQKDIVLGTLDNNEVLPTEYSLSNNYPNPFNPSTIISYSIPNQEYISINIYNILGEQIKTVVNSVHQPGNYSVRWNGKNDNMVNMPSGIYLFRIISGEFVKTKKMLLLR